MALVVADRVQETSITSGTGTLTLAGALAGYQTFSTAIGNGNTTFYTIYDPNLYDWEVGIGTVGAGTLARTTVLSNSAGTTSPISFASNSKFVFCTYPAEKSINYDASGVATIGDVLGYSDSGIVGSFASTVAGYNQVIVQNKSSATNASSNLNVSNDVGTAGSNYAELGINSSTFTGAGSFNIAGASYVASASTDLTLGTYGAYNVHFVTNSNTTDAMTIFNDGGISLGGFANPGIANMAASKFVPGFTAVTAAAGTTILTEDSNYYQNLLGTTTQTFQLPDATTLLVGTTFIFDNDSTGTLSIVDNASGPIDTIPTGGVDYIYLANNSTVAGTWRKHAFIPASYDFNNTTASFGNAAITNAVWNGTTIGTAYGGTGLTSFSAANYALYSTNSSTLTAGTLPVAAGGSGAITFTANGVLYGNGTSPLSVTAAGVTGEVLVGNTGGAPSWATLSSSTVSSFSAGTTGFTPNTATTGAVTLGGTLAVANGGTGTSTSFTTGSVVFAGASGVYSQNNAGFFWDNTNSRLGIGTTSPQRTLDISSTAQVISVFRSSNVGGSRLRLLDLNNVETDGLELLTNTTTSTIVAGSAVTLKPLTFITGGAERMRIDSTGNVGIGNTTAYNKLDIITNGNSNSVHLSNAANTDTGGYLNSTGNSELMLSGGASYNSYSAPNFVMNAKATIASGVYLTGDTIRFWVNTGLTAGTTFNQTERMRIDSSGNVGIGTTSPNVKLDVIGSIEASPAATQDGVILAGRAGGTSSFAVTLTPTTLTASRTVTLPDANINFTAGLGVAQGGTGTTTAQGAMNTFAGAVTTGQYLRGNGTNVVMSAIQAGDVPTLNQNTTGSAATFTSTTQNSQFNSVGVGTAASTTAGEIRATNNVTAFFSDARLKDFKGTIPDALAKVQALNGYYFTENQKAKELGYNNDKVQVGVSAQEVEAVLPEVVTEAPISAEYKTVYYDKLVPLLIEAIKELKAEVDELKKGK